MKKYNGIRTNDIITISYNARLEGGKTVSSSLDEGPLTFKVGKFPKIDAINSVVLGMKVGEVKRVTILPLGAFGEIDKSLISEYCLSILPEYVMVGQRVIENSSSSYMNVLSVDSAKGVALLDGNHFLAGEKISFTVKIISIKGYENSMMDVSA